MWAIVFLIFESNYIYLALLIFFDFINCINIKTFFGAWQIFDQIKIAFCIWCQRHRDRIIIL